MRTRSGFESLRFRGKDARGYNPHELVWQRIRNGIASNEPRIREGDNPAEREEILHWRAPKIDIKSVELPSNQIVTVQAGDHDYGDHTVYLEREYHLLPLTTSFLRNFREHEAITEIFARVNRYNELFPVDNPSLMVGYLGIFDARNIRDVINPLLLGNVQLAVPSYAAVAAFLANPENRERINRVPYLLTQSPFVEDMVEQGSTCNVAFRRGKIEETDVFVACRGHRSTQTQLYEIDSIESHADRIFNYGILFEVRSKTA